MSGSNGAIAIGVLNGWTAEAIAVIKAEIGGTNLLMAVVSTTGGERTFRDMKLSGGEITSTLGVGALW